MVQTAFNGFCMALADSVPGVSGGTIAFILGFYDKLIGSINYLFSKSERRRNTSLRYLIKLGIGWVIGMGGSVLVLSGLFESHIYFMSSLFLGLTVAALPFIIREESDSIIGKYQNIPYALLGAGIVILISMTRMMGSTASPVDYMGLRPTDYLYLMLAGFAAISAMVLPGISGSTVLLIAGVYIPTITAVKQLMGLNVSVVPGLMALMLGVLLGAVTSIKFIKYALDKYRSRMVYLILGLTAGSLMAIVMGPTTLKVPVDALSIRTFSWIGFILGIALLIGLEKSKDLIGKR